MLKSLQKIKKIVMAALSVCAILCFIGSATHFVNAAEGDLSATYTKVAHYEFDDSSNLGKDSLGNYDLVNAGGVVADTINGGAIFGKENGFLYAPDLGEGKDFSDLIDGSFSVSMRLYICDVWEGGNYIIATGSYGSNFCAEWTYGGIQTYLGNNQYAPISNVFSGATFAWHRISWIYDESTLSFRTIVVKEGSETPIHDTTNTLTSEINFGGHTNTFTVGAQSNFGQWIDCLVDGLIGHNNLRGYPNISDLRIYTGAIDDVELSAINESDKTDLPNEEPSNPGVGGGEEGGEEGEGEEKDFTPIAHYEFRNARNFGQDSLGNYDLVNAGGVVLDKTNGGVIIGKEDGLLYAPDLGGGKDFSDSITGSYSISMRVFLCEAWEGGNYLISTGFYGSHLQIDWSYSGLYIHLGNNQSVALGRGEGTLGGVNMLSGTVGAWYRITMIYDEEDLTFRAVVTKEGDSSFSIDATHKLAQKSTFGGHEKSFTVGAQSQFGGAVDCLAESVIGHNSLKGTPSISDLRIYQGVIGNTELENIKEYDEDYLENPPVIEEPSEDEQPFVLNGVFGDNMVLQRNKPVKIWGYGGIIDDTVTVSFNGQEKTTTITKDGWEVYLDPMAASIEKRTLTVTSSVGTLTVKDIVIGEVLFCSGQSNMAITLSYIANKYSAIYDEYSAYQNFDKVRFYTPNWGGKDDERIYSAPYSRWNTPASANDLANISAFAAGLALHTQAMIGGNVPVGVIETSTGGSCIEEWLDKDNLKDANSHISQHSLKQSIYYNGMVHYLKGFALGGVFWYQGERCVEQTESYEDLLPILVNQYRSDFEDENLPVYLMQLPQINIVVGLGSTYYEPGWVEMRGVQERVADKMDNVYAVCIIDTGDKTTHSDCIHPADKWAVTERAAGAFVATALKIPYEELAVKGNYGISPKVVSATIKKGVLTLCVENATSLTVEGGVVKGFKGELENGDIIDLIFTIEGNTLKCAVSEEIVLISYLQVASTDVELVFNEYGTPVMPLGELAVEVDNTDDGNEDSSSGIEDPDSSEKPVDSSSQESLKDSSSASASRCNSSLSGTIWLLPFCVLGLAIMKKKNRE